jgi:membrane fusion protein, copper/silver efflux system
MRTLVFIILGLILSACRQNQPASGENKGSYTCPMHPQIVNEGPGSCPLCGMDLVKALKKTDATELQLDARQQQLANISTITVSDSHYTTAGGKAEIAFNGQIVENPGSVELVSARFTGRIERLLAREAGRAVQKGQALAAVFSEELRSLEEDYILQIRQAEAFPKEQVYKSLRDAARNKLRLFGVSEAQIRRITTSRAPSPAILIAAPSSGILTEIGIAEGQYVNAGAALFRIRNTGSLWVEAAVYATEMDRVKAGTPVEVQIPGLATARFSGNVDVVAPGLDANQMLSVRITIPGDARLQPGMQALVTVRSSGAGKAFTLPQSAVVRSEKGAVAWIKTSGGTFVRRKITTGKEGEQTISVLSGIRAGDEVVVNGAYLLSSELALRTGSGAAD